MPLQSSAQTTWLWHLFSTCKWVCVNVFVWVNMDIYCTNGVWSETCGSLSVSLTFIINANMRLTHEIGALHGCCHNMFSKPCKRRSFLDLKQNSWQECSKWNEGMSSGIRGTIYLGFLSSYWIFLIIQEKTPQIFNLPTGIESKCSTSMIKGPYSIQFSCSNENIPIDEWLWIASPQNMSWDVTFLSPLPHPTNNPAIFHTKLELNRNLIFSSATTYYTSLSFVFMY